jgi:hypothetical protein
LTDFANIIDTLWSLIYGGECVAWIGSGLSKVSGYPDWPVTIEKLCEACEVEKLSNEENKQSDNLIGKAQECKDKNGTLYMQTLAELFSHKPFTRRGAWDYLMKLPFKAYVTTNYDPILSEVGAFYGRDEVRAYPDLPISAIQKYQYPLFYIHGHAFFRDMQTPNYLVLAHQDFETAYKEDGNVNNFVTELFTYYPILFIACDLREPDIYEAFKRAGRIHEKILTLRAGFKRPSKCIILPTPIPGPEAEVGQEERLRAMGIEDVIRYEPSNPDRHEEIEEILEKLCERAGCPVKARFGIGLEEVPTI